MLRFAAPLSYRRVMRHHHGLLPGISPSHLISALLIPDALNFVPKPTQLFLVTSIMIIDRPL